jgi:hypothetical protein
MIFSIPRRALLPAWIRDTTPTTKEKGSVMLQLPQNLLEY